MEVKEFFHRSSMLVVRFARLAHSCHGVHRAYENRASSLLSMIRCERSGGPRPGEKAKNLLLMWSSLPIRARISESSVRVTGCGDDGAYAAGGKSDVRCRLGERNNMNTDSRHTDSSGRTGVPEYP